MKLKSKFDLLLAIILVLNVFDPLAATAAPHVKYVFIISFDQGDLGLIQRSDMPTFHAMAAKGAHDWNACTIVPSLTLPAHLDADGRRGAGAPDPSERLRTEQGDWSKCRQSSVSPNNTVW